MHDSPDDKNGVNPGDEGWDNIPPQEEDKSKEIESELQDLLDEDIDPEDDLDWIEVWEAWGEFESTQLEPPPYWADLIDDDDDEECDAEEQLPPEPPKEESKGTNTNIVSNSDSSKDEGETVYNHESHYVDHFMYEHEVAMQCRDCEDILRRGINAYMSIRKAERKFLARKPNAKFMFNILCTWLAPCDAIDQWIDILWEYGFVPDNLDEYRAAFASADRKLKHYYKKHPYRI